MEIIEGVLFGIVLFLFVIVIAEAAIYVKDNVLNKS
jgi:hypothetical protein